MIILALPSKIKHASDFEHYISDLAGGPPDHPFDEHFFSCLTRFLTTNPAQQIVSIQDSALTHRSKSGPIMLCYIQGHGKPTHWIGIVEDGFTSYTTGEENIGIVLQNFFRQNPSIALPGQIFIDSCFASKAVPLWLKHPNIVECVTDALTAITPHRKQAPTVLGCSGVSIVHPDPNEPIIQIAFEHADETMLLQSCLEVLHPQEVEIVMLALRQFKQKYSVTPPTDARRLDYLKTTSKLIGRQQTPLFDEYIILLKALGYVMPEYFVLNPTTNQLGKLEDSTTRRTIPEVDVRERLTTIKTCLEAFTREQEQLKSKYQELVF